MRRVVRVCLAVSIFGLLFQRVCVAQAPEIKKPSFEVVAIRPSAPEPRWFGYEISPGGRFTGRAYTVAGLVGDAYGVGSTGGPSWVRSKQFDIDAKMDAALAESLNKLPTKEKDAQLGLMLQTVLLERFKLQFRRETKMQRIYALVIAKGGPKLTATAAKPPGPDNSPAAAPDEPMMTVSGSLWTARSVTMDLLAGQISAQSEIGRIVVDETGLKGKYDFEFKWSPSADGSEPSLFVALEEQLGLKLETRTGPVESIVITHVEEPSEN